MYLTFSDSYFYFSCLVDKNSESFGIKITKILTDSSYFILIVLHAGVKIADQQQ